MCQNQCRHHVFRFHFLMLFLSHLAFHTSQMSNFTWTSSLSIHVFAPITHVADLPTLLDFPGQLLSIPESRILVVNSRTGSLRRSWSRRRGPVAFGWLALGSFRQKKSVVRFLQVPLRAFPIRTGKLDLYSVL